MSGNQANYLCSILLAWTSNHLALIRPFQATRHFLRTLKICIRLSFLHRLSFEGQSFALEFSQRLTQLAIIVQKLQFSVVNTRLIFFGPSFVLRCQMIRIGDFWVLVWLRIKVSVRAALLVWTYVAAAFFRARDTGLETVAVTLLAFWFFASAEYLLSQLLFLSFFECSEKYIAVRILGLVFATNTCTLWPTGTTVFETLAIKLETVRWFARACDCYPFCLY